MGMVFGFGKGVVYIYVGIFVMGLIGPYWAANFS
jgi:hypothetical protein